MDVLTILKEEHAAISALLDQAARCDAGDPELLELSEQIERSLTIHAALEERLFYPRLAERSDDRDDVVDVFEGYVEHELIKRLVELLQYEGESNEQIKAEMNVLFETVKRHVKIEESTIFHLARELFDRDELDALGDELVSERPHVAAHAGANARRTSHGTIEAEGRLTPT